MRYYKVKKYGMWEVQAFDMDPSADRFIPEDAIQIPKEEALELAKTPLSPEREQALAESAAALGGRGWSRYPTKEFKEAIGHICVNAAHLEVTIRTLIWEVAGVSAEVGMTLTGGKVAMRELHTTLLALIELRYPHLLDSAKPIVKRLDALHESRNKYVHGLWHPSDDSQAIVSKHFLMRSHAKGDASKAKVSIADLYEVAEGFMKAESDLLSAILGPLMDSKYPPLELGEGG